MEESPPASSLILTPSETAYSFPPHRRRPLRSRTYGELIRILSHCHPQLQMQEPVSGEDGSITHSHVISAEVPVSHTISKGPEDKVVQETSDAETKKNTSFQEFDGNHATPPTSHQPGLVRDSDEALVSSNEISIEDYTDVKEKVDDSAVQNSKELADLNSVLDIQMDDFGTLKDVDMDNDSCFHQLNEVLDSCFDLDTVVESSEARQLSQEEGIVSEGNITKDVEHELQMKEVELEKLIYSSGNTETPLCQNDEDIEEGEISGDAGVADDTSDTLSKGAVDGEETTENLHASEGSFNIEKLLCEDKDGGRQHGMTDPLEVNIKSNSNNVKNILPAGQSQDYYYLDVLSGTYKKTSVSGDTSHCLDNLTPSGRMLQASSAERQISESTETEEDATTKKRKRTLTKERRAKKKKKERIKRAEKNRESGVKRLKLPTINMPKKIVYCRHYLQGRCHEGEKCKFSHDTVPLTKSKPCGHFARHSCMKGDDCPFDHQLSKYPCNNFTLNGFCSRGSECMFSHEIPAKSPSAAPNVPKHDLITPQKVVPEKEGSHPLSKVNKSDYKFPSPLENPSSSRPVDSSATPHLKFNSRLCSASKSTSQRDQLGLKSAPGTSVRAPRGVSFLSNGADASKDNKEGSPAKKPYGVGVTLKVPGGNNELNEISEMVAPRKPRGINFLSFGQPPSDDSGSKTLSNLLSNLSNGADKSALDDRGKEKMKESAINSVSDLKATGTPLTLPQNVNFLSSDGARLDVSTSKGKANVDSSRGDTVTSSVNEIRSISELQDATGIRVPSFLGQNSSFSSSSFLSNTPTMLRKAVHSTLAFAAQLEPDIRIGSHHQRIS